MQHPSKIICKNVGPVSFVVIPHGDGTDGFSIEVPNHPAQLILKAGERLEVTVVGTEVTLATAVNR